ncbi:hypothetical protein KQX54_006539 [Cotesia glomerata]|uniref:Uncharacterized protein n=1 Tax=Cotesia glomerata TaxID=32391 RepID=A0AAV7J4T9_COTGL|nr:hypothetical protein KQX54_006539 [Cotesia glomerata]
MKQRDWGLGRYRNSSSTCSCYDISGLGFEGRSSGSSSTRECRAELNVPVGKGLAITIPPALRSDPTT